MIPESSLMRGPIVLLRETPLRHTPLAVAGLARMLVSRMALTLSWSFLASIDAELDGDIHGFVELFLRGLPDRRASIFDGVALVDVDQLGRFEILFTVLCHVPGPPRQRPSNGRCRRWNSWRLPANPRSCPTS